AAWTWRLTCDPTMDDLLPGFVTVIVLPLLTIGWDTSQPPAPLLKSFAQVDWTAKEPVVSEMFWAAPWPDWIHAHLSPFSLPLLSVQPPAGNWSVTVSAYSWPSTIVTPSSVPAEPPFTKFSPQLVPASRRYGRLVNASWPTGVLTAPPESVESPV